MCIYKIYLSLVEGHDCEADEEIKALLFPYVSASKALLACSSVSRRNRTLIRENLELLKYHSLLKQNNNNSARVYSLYSIRARKTRLPRIRKNYNIVKAQYLSKKGLKSIVDDADFEKYIFSQTPKQVFSDEEIDLWKSIYSVATSESKQPFGYMERQNHRRNYELKNSSFVNFINFLRQNPSVQSKDRFFFAFYQTQTQCDDKTKRKVDYLLRYLSQRAFFSVTDIELITGDTISEKDFFDTVSLLTQCKKSSAKLLY